MARDNLKQPPNLVYLAVFAPGAHSPSLETLRTNYQALASESPLLQCKIGGRRTASPRWVMVQGAPDVQDFVQERALDSYGLDDCPETEWASDGAGEDAKCKWLQHILKREVADSKRNFNVETGRMINVRRIFSNDTDQNKPTFIAMTIHHVLTDGLGGARLFSKLLSPCEHKPITKMVDFPPPLEDTVDTSCSWTRLAKFGLSEILLPNLPSFIRQRFEQRIWPAVDEYSENAHSSLGDYPLELGVQHVEQGVLDRLSKTGKVMNVSVHAILCASLCMALQGSIPLQDRPEHSTWDISIDMPMSDRNTRLGHPEMTGNYVVPGQVHQTVTAPSSSQIRGSTFLPDDEFWKIAQGFSRDIKGDMRINGRGVWGMLRYVSTAEMKPSPLTEQGVYTGWEEMLWSKLAPPHKITTSAEISNLGKFDLKSDFASAQSVLWCQSVMPFAGTAFELSVMSAQGGGTWFTWGWRQGLVNSETMEKIMKGFTEILCSDVFSPTAGVQ